MKKQTTKTNPQAKAGDFDSAFKKSLELLADGYPVRKMLAAIGMTWGQYWPHVSHTADRRNAYLEALNTRTEYFKLVATDRLTEAALCDTREVPTARGIAIIHAHNTAAISKLVDFLHRPGAEEDENAGLRAFQEAMQSLKMLNQNPDKYGPQVMGGSSVLPQASPDPAPSPD